MKLYSTVKPLLHKIFIPYSAFEDMKTALSNFDVTTESVYGNGELQSLTSTIGLEAKAAFKRKMDEIILSYKADILDEQNWL